MKSKLFFFLLSSLLLFIFSLYSQLEKVDLATLNQEDVNTHQGEVAGIISNFTPTEPKPISLLFVGDIMLARGVQQRAVERNKLWPFDGIYELINSSNLTIGNLESLLGPVSTTCIDCFRFTITAPEAEILQNAGFDLLSIANNHANDYVDSPQLTADTLQKLGIMPVGLVPNERNTQIPQIVNIDNYTIGFLAYTDVTNTIFANVARAQEEQIARDLENLKTQADYIVTIFHWGKEYTHQPTSRQKQLAHLAIDFGADLVIGHHAHWVQPIEVYKQKPIFYGLGNCVFNMMHSLPTRQGIAVKVTLNRAKGDVESEVVPLIIEDYARPRIVEESEQYYTQILDTVKNLSYPDLTLPNFELSLEK